MTADPYEVVVIDDDPDSLLLIEDVLGRRGGMRVTTAGDAATALVLLSQRPCDVVVTDVELPGMSGLELLAQLRQGHPGLPVVIITAYPTVEYAVSALRSDADEFLQKPFDLDDLLRVVRRLASSGRERQAAGRHRVLAVGAHPDDVEIGVGGLLSAHAARGDTLAVVTLTRGARGGETMARSGESRSAAELLGARLFLADLTDTQLPVSDPTLSFIQQAIGEMAPDVIYTHSLNDFHQDHRAVHQATMVAARKVPTVACYQSPSATVDFQPNRFAAIDEQLDRKLALLACYRSQVEARDYLDPELITATARYWSRFGGGRYSEPLEVIRDRTTLDPTAATLSVREREASYVH